jgi:hypothetical protein
MHAVAWIVVLAVLVASRPALAYLDPGTGNLVLQVVVAALVTASLVFRRLWGPLAGGFRRFLGRPAPPDAPGGSGPA